jgi:hypothetical protein
MIARVRRRLESAGARFCDGAGSEMAAPTTAPPGDGRLSIVGVST